VAALALGGLLVCTNISNAQDAKEGKKRGFTPQARVEQLDKELKLTADQKTKLTALFEDQTKKMRDLRADTNLSQEDRRAKSRTMMEESNKKMKDILTPDQFEKWQKMRDEMKGKGGGKGKKSA
jgi:Spy/CpxP family protein refolding chaperone